MTTFENFFEENPDQKFIYKKEDYMKSTYELKIIPDTEESGYVAYYPELLGCITCGETVESAKANAEDAKREWLQTVFNDLIDEQNL